MDMKKLAATAMAFEEAQAKFRAEMDKVSAYIKTAEQTLAEIAQDVDMDTRDRDDEDASHLSWEFFPRDQRRRLLFVTRHWPVDGEWVKRPLAEETAHVRAQMVAAIEPMISQYVSFFEFDIELIGVSEPMFK